MCNHLFQPNFLPLIWKVDLMYRLEHLLFFDIPLLYCYINLNSSIFCFLFIEINIFLLISLIFFSVCEKASKLFVNYFCLRESLYFCQKFYLNFYKFYQEKTKVQILSQIFNLSVQLNNFSIFV